MKTTSTVPKTWTLHSRSLYDGGPWYNLSMGIDVGAVLTCRVSGTGDDGARRVLWVSQLKTWGELRELLNEHPIRCAVIDALPETVSTRQLADNYPCVVRATFPDRLAESMLVPWIWAGTQQVAIDRVQALGQTIARIQSGLTRWPDGLDTHSEIVNELSTSPDDVIHHTLHFLWASLYDDIAEQIIAELDVPMLAARTMACEAVDFLRHAESTTRPQRFQNWQEKLHLAIDTWVSSNTPRSLSQPASSDKAMDTIQMLRARLSKTEIGTSTYAETLALLQRAAQAANSPTTERDMQSWEAPTTPGQFRRLVPETATSRWDCPIDALYEDTAANLVITHPSLPAARQPVEQWIDHTLAHALLCGAALWAPKHSPKKGINLGYIVPTSEEQRRFVHERLPALERALPEFARSQHGGSSEFRQVGDSYLYIRHTQSQYALKSFVVDLALFDGMHQIDSAAVEMIERRMRVSDIQRVIAIGAPMRDVARRWRKTDQRQWKTLCPACGRAEMLTPLNCLRGNGEIAKIWRSWTLDQLRSAVWTTHCLCCDTSIDPAGPGCWVPRAPGHAAKGHGYQLPTLCWPNIDLADLAVQIVGAEYTTWTTFYHTTLGLV